MTDEVVLPAPCLVVLVGPAGAGKSTWAAAHFASDQIVSSDALRAVVGESDADLGASTDAFTLLEQIVDLRVKRRLTTVLDTLGLDADRRARWLALARRHDLATVAVVFATSAAECKARSRARGKPVPDKVLGQQVRATAAFDATGFDIVVEPTVVRTAPAKVARSAALAAQQARAPATLQFGLNIPVYPSGDLRERLRAIAVAAEQAGFVSISVMDHFRQIPMFGPKWEPMLESYTTLAYLAGVTERVRLGTLVTGVTFRNVAHFGKIVATLDVLSGGRAFCGLGLAWNADEHAAYGWDFPPVADRYALLEDALEFLPKFWGKGAPAYKGRVIDVPEAMCYPRPLQAHIPILVGGSGERHTLRLAAQYADACNIVGDVDTVAHKAAVLRRHCEAIGRDPADVEVTQLGTTLVGRDATELAALVDRLRPRRQSAERYAASVNAGTVRDQIGRYRALADAGVGTAMLAMPDLDEAAIERFAPVITAFS